jgi:hypothetical protein
MPYISNEQVKAIREQLKKALPAYKFSVTKEHYTGVRIAILSGPVKLSDRDHEQVNQFYIKEHYTGTVKKVLQTVCDIATKDQHEQQYDIDYGSIPNYYVNIAIGQWDKPYIVKN